MRKNQHLTGTKRTFSMSCSVIHKTNLIKIGINLLALWPLCVLMTSLFAYHKYTINIKSETLSQW